MMVAGGIIAKSCCLILVETCWRSLVAAIVDLLLFVIDIVLLEDNY